MSHDSINAARVQAYYRRSAAYRQANPDEFAERFQRGLAFQQQLRQQHAPVESTRPSYPAGDTLVGDARHGWVSYGPRVLRGETDVEPPDTGEVPQFWGVYRWNATQAKWRWVLDVLCIEQARSLSRHLLINPHYCPEPEDVVA